MSAVNIRANSAAARPERPPISQNYSTVTPQPNEATLNLKIFACRKCRKFPGNLLNTKSSSLNNLEVSGLQSETVTNNRLIILD